jgi:hypothetical protein
MITNFDRLSRSEIRKMLAEHMKRYDLTPSGVARIINDNSAAVGGTISADSIRRFLDASDPIKVGSKRLAVITGFLRWHGADEDVARETIQSPGSSDFPLAGLGFPVSALDAFTLSMGRFFTEDVGVAPVYDIYTGQAMNIVGSYSFFRPCWQIPNRPDLVSVSIVQIDQNDFGFTMTETQDLPAWEDIRPFQQIDTGAVAALGKFLYFLIKEEGEGLTVKFGQIDSVRRNIRHHPVEWFSGMLFNSSIPGVARMEKFLCRRIEDAKPMRQGINILSELDDLVAKAFFLTE